MLQSMGHEESDITTEQQQQQKHQCAKNIIYFTVIKHTHTEKMAMLATVCGQGQ